MIRTNIQKQRLLNLSERKINMDNNLKINTFINTQLCRFEIKRKRHIGKSRIFINSIKNHNFLRLISVEGISMSGWIPAV